jgi:Putative transposase
MAASVQQRIAFGERAGQKIQRIGAGFGYEGEAPTLTGPRCASVQGFSLHANTQVPAHRRDQLERLIRYTARGAVSLERLTQEANGDLVYTFTHPWSDGTTGMKLSPLELLEKLAALVPLPRVHLVRYGGCVAPHSSVRRAITPTPRQQRHRRARGQHRVASLELGTTAEARLCTGHGALPVVSAGGAADHRSHNAGRGDPEDPPASETRSGPTPDYSSTCPPRSLCLVLRLIVRDGERTRLRLRQWGGTKPPSSYPPPARPMGGEGGPSYVMPVPPAHPAAARLPHPSLWQRPARPLLLHQCLATRLCSLSHRLHPPLAQPPLRSAYPCARGLNQSHTFAPDVCTSPALGSSPIAFEPVLTLPSAPVPHSPPAAADVCTRLPTRLAPCQRPAALPSPSSLPSQRSAGGLHGGPAGALARLGSGVWSRGVGAGGRVAREHGTGGTYAARKRPFEFP